jgi:hypothetical protein
MAEYHTDADADALAHSPPPEPAHPAGTLADELQAMAMSVPMSGLNDDRYGAWAITRDWHQGFLNGHYAARRAIADALAAHPALQAPARPEPETA